jgi:hypothetical protein
MPTVKQADQRVLGKKTPTYQFIKFKIVPTVPTSLLDAAKNNIITEISKAVGTEGPASNLNNRCCGDCGKFHLSSCGFPNGNFETLAADWWAGELKCFIPKQPEMPNFEEKAEDASK